MGRHKTPWILVTLAMYIVYTLHTERCVDLVSQSVSHMDLDLELRLRSVAQLHDVTVPIPIIPFVPVTLINPHNFTYLINQAKACDSHTTVIIFVHSAVNNTELRSWIRKTWASVSIYKTSQFRTVFMLGKPLNLTLQDQVMQESRKHKDIIQEDFVDTYKNLTYKHLMGLKWIFTFCAQAKHIVKVDDDVFINIFRLVDLLDIITKNDKQKMIYCSVYKHSQPNRTFDSKWYVSKQEYDMDVYPFYCKGLAYVMTPDLPKLLYYSSLMTTYFWVDDVYITGMLRMQIGTNLHGFPTNYGFALMSDTNTTLNKVNSVTFLLDKNIRKKELWMALWNATVRDSMSAAGSGMLDTLLFDQTDITDEILNSWYNSGMSYDTDIDKI